MSKKILLICLISLFGLVLICLILLFGLAAPLAAQSLSEIQRAADKGDAEAQFTLGEMYYLGQSGLKKDLAKAAAWYQKSADLGFAMAQYKMGLFNEQGLGQEQNDNVFAVSIIIMKDAPKAAEWYQKAVDQGLPDAMNSLGFLYATGRGVEKDLARAARLYEQAAAQGHAGARKALEKLAAPR